MTPKPAIRSRKTDAETVRRIVDAGFSSVQARILAGRPDGLPPTPEKDLPERVTVGLRRLSRPLDLPDMALAASRVARAIQEGEVIGIETDFDVDGATAHAVIRLALLRFGVPEDRLRSYIGHRLRDGYGLTDPVARRILDDDPRPTLVITADNGSSNEEQIRRLRDAGIETIVTDHHEIPEQGIPESALAVVSPARRDGAWSDRTIAGCMVAWLLMCVVRNELVTTRPNRDLPQLTDLLDYVVLGTVADCVSLGIESGNNRAVVRYGLKRINQGLRPWHAVCRRNPDEPVTTETLAFHVAPAINARSRLNEPMAGVGFLLAETQAQARDRWAVLARENERRKEIERTLKEEAMSKSSKQVEQGRWSLAVVLETGHAGVHGIVASRLTEAFGRPAIVFSPAAEPGCHVGSARGIDGFHVREALQHVHDRDDGILLRFGGHQGAAGATVASDRLDDFADRFEQAVRAQLSSAPEPVLLTDGEIEVSRLSVGLLDEIAALAPFGRGFPYPAFEITAEITEIRRIGDGRHLSLVVSDGGNDVRAVWFHAVDPAAEELPFGPGDAVRLVAEPRDNHWNGRRTLQLVVRHAVAVQEEQD